MRLLEVDMEPSVYDEWHIPGATRVDWEADLAGEHGRDLVSRDEFSSLLGDLGISNDTSVVIYGDEANWFASHAYWIFTYYGHEDVQLMNGGRHYWASEEYPTTTEEPSFTPREYDAAPPDETIRATTEAVEEAVDTDETIIDVRSPGEYQGRTSRPGSDAETEVGGHIPGAENVHWGEAVTADGKFKPHDQLNEIYASADEDGTVCYCQIGERASLSRFVLHELLGHDARNYIGSWMEWSQRDETANA